MDLAGLAALFGLPAALIAALWPGLIERSALAQLERFQKSRAGLSPTGEEQTMLDAVQNRMVRRLAYRVLAPKHMLLLIGGCAFFVVGIVEVGLVVWWEFQEVPIYNNQNWLSHLFLGNAPLDPWYFKLWVNLAYAALCVTAGVIQLLARRTLRAVHIEELVAAGTVIR
ncbi:hypothetical protein [Curtobacterium sp. MCLR17_054]|uniref:hypothetical protein n=1 Tax=Curtobacterium sp. MCLR17_054 TaxID=2175632 RepID=UPI0024DF430A|nr:hypothetical protein [Curtobacterium sp. MCLR17_054]WIE69704.1 hypothetical protein DEJ08_006975 [Curtobacterium sp. MCLR17_054]